MNEFLQKSLQKAKRAVIALTGFTVLLVGAAMIFLPGPAVLIIPAGLAILASEFVWARRLLKKVKERLISSQERFFTRSPK
jgi:uncharacterized protein (TIGR02611 family)